ncbi:MAG: ClC family H(+)/Cl(-) exchange transporter [Anaerolineae bacterium]
MAAEPHAEQQKLSQGLVRLTLVALGAGALTGLVGGLFRLGLEWADKARVAAVTFSHGYPYLGWLFPVLGAAICVAIARFLVRFEPLAAGSGVQHVEAVMRGEAQPPPPGVLPVKFVGGLLSLGAGMALGREGPTVQMGSVIGSWCGRWLRLPDEDIRSLQAATAGAGLGVAFNAPLGGTLFVFEEVARVFRVRLAVMALAASAVAMGVAHLLLGNPIEFTVTPPTMPGFLALAVYLALGLALGVLGAAYNRVIIIGLDIFERVAVYPVELRAALVGAVVGGLAWFDPWLVGGGDVINQRVLVGSIPLTTLAAVFLLRWFLGPFCYSASTPGGLFAPLLVIGAAFGFLFAGVLGVLMPGLGLSPVAFAIVGMSTFFVSVVRSPLTGLVLVIEMTATTTLIAPMLVAAAAALLVTTLLGSSPIYDTLRERMLRRMVSHPAPSDTPRYV